jgi:hypothetical protein
MQPEIRYFIPCWKEPTIKGTSPSAHEIINAVQLKEGFSYPAWQRPYFILAVITNLHGTCDFHLELRLEEMENEIAVYSSDVLSLSAGNDPLRIHSVSVMMKATRIPRPGVYQVCFLWREKVLARATIHAR